MRTYSQPLGASGLAVVRSPHNWLCSEYVNLPVISTVNQPLIGMGDHGKRGMKTDAGPAEVYGPIRIPSVWTRPH